MKNGYTFTVTCNYDYYGYPEAQRKYTIEGDYLTARITWYGNRGPGEANVNCKHQCNGYFWSLHNLMNAIYSGRLLTWSVLGGLKEEESKKVTIGYDDDFKNLIIQ